MDQPAIRPSHIVHSIYLEGFSERTERIVTPDHPLKITVECNKKAAIVKLNHRHNGDTFAKTFLPPMISSLVINEVVWLCELLSVDRLIWSPKCDGPWEETLI